MIILHLLRREQCGELGLVLALNLLQLRRALGIELAAEYPVRAGSRFKAS
jgi:hypothetical protein